ncbi:MAG: hypothetical protein BucCj_2410 [Buchnera aphidicola (Ceratovacuna japonica)]
MYVIFFIFFIVISIALNFMIITQKGKMLEIHDFYREKNKNKLFFFNILKNNLTNKIISILSLFFFFFDLVLCNLMTISK